MPGRLPTPPTVFQGAVEGLVDEAILRRLVREAGAEVGAVFGKEGKDQLLRKGLRGYNNAARRSPWIVLVDLDREECAPSFLRRWLPDPAPFMLFRIAVRTAEAWLMADAEALARFLGIEASRVPVLPEAEVNPKKTFVDLARHSPLQEIRREVVPRPGSRREVGPAYTTRLVELVENHWRPEVAAESSDSLRRCRSRLRELARRG